MTDAVCLECGADAAAGAKCPRCGQTVIRRAALLLTAIAEVAPQVPPEVDAASADPSKRLEQYLLMEEIGRGGAGSVFRAWDEENSRFVALKVLRDDSPAVAARFVREVQSASRLSHPAIVKIHRSGEWNKRRFIAMELIHGRSLAELLDAARPPLRLLVTILADACGAIRHAHAKGIVHRDLKPQNILVDGDHHAYVVDFGLARPTEPGWTVTIAQETAGTPGYMAPESVRGGPAALAPTVDVYALGAVLYHLLAGRPPFVGIAPYEVMERVVRDLPDPLPADAPADLKAVCLKCLEKEPSRRYVSAGELERELRRWLEGLPVQSRAASLTESARRFLWRRGAAVAGALLVLVAGLAWPVVVQVRNRATAKRVIAAALDLEAAGRLAEARDRFREARDLGHRDGAAGFDRTEGALRRAQAMVEETRALLEGAGRRLRLPEADAVALLAEIERAAVTLRAAVRLDPSLTAGHDQLGRACELLGRETEAEACWGRAGDLPSARLSLGRLLVRKSFMASLGTSRSLRARQAAAAPIATAASELLRRTVASLDTPIATDVAAGLLAFLSDDEAQVRQVAERHLGRGEGADEEFHWLLGIVARAETREKHFTLALAAHANHVPSLFCRGAHRASHGRPAEALADFDRAARCAPELIPLLEQRAVVLLALGRSRDARRELDRAIELDASRASLYSNRGSARLEGGDSPGAIEDFGTAIRLDGTLAEARVNRSIAQLNAKDAVAALADAEQAAAIDPHLPGAFVARGRSRAALGERDGALQDFSEALRLDPGHVRARLLRASLNRELRRYPAALDDLNQLLRRAESFDVLIERGRTRGSSGDQRGALADFERAASLDSGSLDARAFIAIAHAELGERERAVRELKLVLADAPVGWTGRAGVERLIEAYSKP